MRMDHVTLLNMILAIADLVFAAYTRVSVRPDARGFFIVNCQIKPPCPLRPVQPSTPPLTRVISHAAPRRRGAPAARDTASFQGAAARASSSLSGKDS